MNNNLDVFKKLCEGMIKKDKNLLDEALHDDSILIHMTGHMESKNEYISDILNGTLNYYDYEIISFNDKQAAIRLLAKVYGGSKSWWTLKMTLKYKDNKIIESKVSLA